MKIDTLTRIPVVKLTTVYGDTLYVAQCDWDGLGTKSPYLPIFTRDGRLWENTKAGQDAVRNCQPTHVHRDNLVPTNIVGLSAVAKAAERLLAKLDNITTDDFMHGGERTEREELRDALKLLHI